MRTARLLVFAAALLAVTAALVTALPAAAKSTGTPTYTFSTATNEINSGSFNQGWWSTNRSNSNGNSNYEVGRNEAGDILHDFFTFGLSGSTFACTPSSAILHVDAAAGGNQALFHTGPASLTYDLFDVTTDPFTLNNKASNPNSTIYNDLGSGTPYGSYTLSTSAAHTTFNLSLNANALYDLGVAKQHGAPFFSIGGAIIPNPSANFNFLFGISTNAATLTVTYPRLCRVYP